MGASLDHAVWFHRPLRADEWFLYDLHGRLERGGAGAWPAGPCTAVDGVIGRVGGPGGAAPRGLIGCQADWRPVLSSGAGTGRSSTQRTNAPGPAALDQPP